MPTTGLQALAAALALGFKEIHIIGMDFYQSTNKRYAYKVPRQIKNNMAAKHFKPGYEKGSHSLDADLNAWSVLVKSFPDAKIYSISENSYLSNLTELSRKQDQPNDLFIRKSNSDRISTSTDNIVKSKTKRFAFHKFLDFMGLGRIRKFE